MFVLMLIVAVLARNWFYTRPEMNYGLRHAMPSAHYVNAIRANNQSLLRELHKKNELLAAALRYPMVSGPSLYY